MIPPDPIRLVRMVKQIGTLRISFTIRTRRMGSRSLKEMRVLLTGMEISKDRRR